MSYHQRPHDLRLAIACEAEALMSDFGGEACAQARRRAEEASSDFLARDWSEAALMIARKMGKRSSLLARCFVNRGARQLGSLFRNFVGSFGPWASGASNRSDSKPEATAMRKIWGYSSRAWRTGQIDRGRVKT
jgi:hypothetical protein